MAQNETEHMRELLLKYSLADKPEVRKMIEETLWSEYGRECTVFVLDMSGFSMLTRKYGIVHYLSMVRRMQLTTEPIARSYNGRMIKFEADNLFAVFPDPLSAVNAAVAMQHAFKASNLFTTDDLDIHISCGIDYGRILVIADQECFGDAVNRACKLGEDAAAADEILITGDAMHRIPAEAGIQSREINVTISGLSIPAHVIEYRRAE
jgi:adenylate cyclase